MHHIVQNGLTNDREFDQLLDALHDAKVTYSIVKVVPFANEIMPDINPEGPVIAWGAHTMCKVAKKKDWKPGVFLNDNFDMRVLHEHYKEDMLNYDGIFCKFGEIPKFEGKRFIRPVYDDKAFTGLVVHSEEIEKWKEDIFGIESDVLTVDTPVLVSSDKQLDCEARFFVVNGQVITGSTYRVFGNQIRKRIDSDNPLGVQLLNFAKQKVNWWIPAKAFVIDIALCNGECKIIEINCLNASGYYDCDVRSIIYALELCQPKVYE
jgi:hypothetical protein